MKGVFTFLFMIVVLPGCLPVVTADDPVRPILEQTEINQLCLDLRQTKSFEDLLQSIRRDTDQIFRIGRQTDKIQNSVGNVKVLAERIRVNSDILQEKIEPRFSDPRFNQSLQWIIRPVDFRFILNEDPTGAWRASSMEVLRVYSRGAERSDLKNQLHAEIQSSDLLISFERPAGALEICEFERTLVVVANIQFLGRYGPQKVRVRLMKNQGERR